MTKDEINKKIFELKNEQEIINFINERLNELESDSVEKTVGQNYTDCFQEYISQKIHYKAAEKFNDSECPDLVYDDITPYYNLIKKIREGSWYNELILFTTIFYVVHKYLPTDKDIGLGRYMTYLSHKGKRMSIKTISENGVAFCSEKSGMAHNMFKFLGIDSEVVCGARGNELHAYNFVYPNGYGNEPMVLFDVSHFLNFINGDNRVFLGFYKAFSKQDYGLLKSGNPIQIDLTKTEETYRKLYGAYLEDYDLKNESPVYIYGLKNAKNYKSSIPRK